MIVMKFGGASLSSPVSFQRVASIIQSEVARSPVVVVSAIGDTTDNLLAILSHASRAEMYQAWKIQEETALYHHCLAEDLLRGKYLTRMDREIRKRFRDLHVCALEIGEGERRPTGEVRDRFASTGEKLASQLLAIYLEQQGTATTLADAEKLMLTDDQFTQAEPRYWETCARIRWSLPLAARSSVVVMAGFIGATEDGRTTTLGRGGSDLTASIVGAAVNADEIQFWKDVDGILTWDPRSQEGAWRIRNLSYNEAAEIAQAGAAVLHPETIAPAQRARIPLRIRNTFRPEGEGTTIRSRAAHCSNDFKAMAWKKQVTLMELRPAPDSRGLNGQLKAVERLCREQKRASLLGISQRAIFLALPANEQQAQAEFAVEECVEAHLRTNQTIITLVGECEVDRATVRSKAIKALRGRPALVLPEMEDVCSLRVATPDEEFDATMAILRRTFFRQMDPAFFAACEPAELTGRAEERRKAIRRAETPRVQRPFRGTLPAISDAF